MEGCGTGARVLGVEVLEELLGERDGARESAPSLRDGEVFACPAPKRRSREKVSLPSLTAETSNRVVSRGVRIDEASSCRASHAA